MESEEKHQTVRRDRDEGVRKAEELAGVESFSGRTAATWPHLIDYAMKAESPVQTRQALTPSSATGEGAASRSSTSSPGRILQGRQWSDGLHQAVEAKRRAWRRSRKENQTLATITLQNFFRMYDKLAGMTGTAMTEANEFWKIYKLEVIAIPTNPRPRPHRLATT